MIPHKIIVHCSDTEDGPSFSTSAIKKYHVEHNGWRAIGYHALVENVNGDYFAIFGRPWDMSGAHTLGQNDWSLGLCFVGKYDHEEPPEAMLLEGAKVVKTWMDLYGIPLSEIHKHSEYADKTCPGTMFPWVKFLNMCR